MIQKLVLKLWKENSTIYYDASKFSDIRICLFIVLDLVFYEMDADKNCAITLSHLSFYFGEIPK